VGGPVSVAMQVSLVDQDRIEAEWPDIAEILAPAVRGDPKQTIEGLHKRLVSGADSLLEITGPGRCLLVLEVTNDLICWTKYLAGHIDGGPKARVAIIRGAVRHIEASARDAGCKEHRLCGRDWHRILPDYRSFDGFPNGLRKELHNGWRRY
jgi:hypothetical protein